MKRTGLFTQFSPLAVIAGIALVLGSTGCDSNRGEYVYYGKQLLRGGRHVPSQMSGWVAVPGHEPKPVEDKNAGITYAVLATHDIVPATLSGWVALKPGLFAKMSDIKLDAPKDDAAELYVLHPGSLIPLEMSNWVALPNSQPEVEISATKKDHGLAKLAADNIIPKELNGWVAVDAETLSKLTEKYMMTGKGSK